MSKPEFIRSLSVPAELRCSSDSAACYKKHTHEEFSVGVVDGGVSEFIVRNTVTTIEAGSMVIINPNEVHSCNPQAGTRWSYKMLYVCPVWLKGIQEQLLGRKLPELLPFKRSLLCDAELESRFQKLAWLFSRRERE